MPHLLFRGVTVDQVRSISRPLVEELSLLCQCPPDHFILECLHTTAVFDGETVASYPFVEVAWFYRAPEIRHRFAEILDRRIRSLGIPEAEIAFRVYREAHYYINGMAAGEEEPESAAALHQALQTEKEKNVRLREQLQKAAKRPTVSASDSAMSSRLRDALRE